MMEIISKINDSELKNKINQIVDYEIENKLELFLKSSNYACLVMEKSPYLILKFIVFILDLRKGEFHLNYHNKLNYYNLYPEIDSIEDINFLFEKLRLIKNEETVILGMMEFLKINTVAQTIWHLSILADFCIYYSIKGSVLKLKNKYGMSVEEIKDNLLIIAMGKLGGEELNISSDIDLIFFVKDEILLDENKPNNLNEILINLLGFLRNSSPEGFLYRVDLRLRPEGESGPVMMGVNNAIEYYRTRSRQWELQAMIKSRLVWGNENLYLQFRESIEKIIYAHHNPQKILVEIREIKESIESRIQRSTKGINIKLSPGGIRDIEFIIQFLQLIHGIRYPEIRKNNSMSALQSLKTFKIITEKEYEILSSNYILFRKIENILQFRFNTAEQVLPAKNEIIIEIFFPWFMDQGEFTINKFAADFKIMAENNMKSVRNIFTSLFDDTIRYLKVKDSLIAGYPDLNKQLLDDHFLRMDSEYFLQFNEAEIVEHIKMIEKLNNDNLVEITIHETGREEWKLCIIAFDYYYEFSKISGLISANYLKIIKGESFTYCDYRMISPDYREQFYRRRKKQIYSGHIEDNNSSFLYKRKIVCTVTAKIMDTIPDGSIGPGEYSPDWSRFKTDLNRILHYLDNKEVRLAEEYLNNRILNIIPKIPSSMATSLYPVEIDVDNESSSQYTILHIKSRDSFAFLYTFTNVLALKNYYIFKVEIDTVQDTAIDRLFIMTADGSKIVSKEKIEELKITVTLIKQYSSILLNTINPDKALHYFDELLNRVLESGEKKELPILGQSDVQKKLAAIFGISDFLWEDLIRLQYHTLLPILTEKSIEYRFNKEELIENFHNNNLFNKEEVEPDYSKFVEALNQYKDKEMFRIDLRQLLKKIDIINFAFELSDLAEAIIELTLTRIETELLKKYSFPELPPWAIFGLGKMGGRELGYASDIELMLIYDIPENLKEFQLIDGYFEKMLQMFLQAIHTKREGIFEIDLNLRPFGKEGKLAVSKQNFMDYFSAGGKAYFFERQSLIKLRFLSSNKSGSYLRDSILIHRDGYVYSSINPDLESLYKVREKQLNANIKDFQTFNIKYSRGGLVDMEYIVQILQIRYGYKYASLKTVSTLEALKSLLKENIIFLDMYTNLSECYIFYRNLINILRMVKGNAKDLNIYPEDSIEYGYLIKRSFFIGIIGEESKDLLKEKVNYYKNMIISVFNKLKDICMLPYE